MDLRQIRFFIQVAKLKSFTKAAVSLNVSQPALSKQIRLLEDELSVQLLYRTTRGVSLTEAGEVLLKHGESLLRQAQLLTDKVSNAAQTPAGNVSVGFPPSLAKVAQSLLERCRKDYPKVQLHLIEGLSIFLEEWLTLGRIDIAVMSGSDFGEGFLLSKIGSEKFYLVGHNNSDWAHRKVIPVNELSKLDLVITRGFKQTIGQSISGSKQTIEYKYEVDSISLLKELIFEASYATLLPESVIAQEALGQTMAIVEISEPQLSRDIVIAINPRSRANYAHKTVKEALVEELKLLVPNQ